MRTGAARLLALALGVAATGAGAFSLAPSAQASACDKPGGVTVVVDYGSAGGTSTGCAAGDPATGLVALTTSAHAYTFLTRQPGFICTIDAKPDPCNDGPANAYWSYWHALPGGSWIYATEGAATYNPLPGSVEGWSFGSGKPPSSSAPARAPATIPGTTPSPTTALIAPTSRSATSDVTADGDNGLRGLTLGIGIVVPMGALAGFLAWRRRSTGN